MAPARGTRGAPSPFGDPFTFGKPLVLHSEPPPPAPAPALARGASGPPGASVPTEDPMPARKRRVGGYGVTPPDPSYDSNAMRPARRKPPPRGSAPGVAEVFAGAFPTRSDGAVETYLGADGFAEDLPPEDPLVGGDPSSADPSRRASERATRAARDLRAERRATRGRTHRTRPPPLAPAFPTAAEFAARGADAITVVVADASRRRVERAEATPRVAFGGRPPPMPNPKPNPDDASSDPHRPPTPDRRDRGTRRDEETRERDGTRPGSSKGPPRAPLGGPAFSFGVRASSSWAGASSLFAGPGKDSPGPAAYYDPYPANASDAIRGHVPGTAFGKPPEKREAERRSGGGAYVWGSGAFPAPDPSAPGPGHYDPDVTIKANVVTGPAFTIGERVDPANNRGDDPANNRGDDPGDARRSSEFSVPGPGTYDVDAPATRPGKKFTFGARTGRDWSEAGPGRDAPAPGRYFVDAFYRDGAAEGVGGSKPEGEGGSCSRGAGFSFGAAPKFPKETADPVPGPGRYYLDGEDEKEGGDPEKDGSKTPGGVRGSKPSRNPKRGFTFGVRRADPLEASSPNAALGPGAYHRDPAEEDPEHLRDGPAFSLAGRLRSGNAMDPADAAKASFPGPWAYQSESARNPPAGPAFTMAPRVGPSESGRGSGEPVPGPGAYPVHELRSSGGPSFTMYARVEDPALRASADVPGPGAYIGNVGGSIDDATVPTLRDEDDPERFARSRSRLPGPTLKSRDAWRSGWVPAGAESAPGPHSYVTDKTARPAATAPSFTMAARTSAEGSKGGAASGDLGPGEYAGDDPGAAFVFGGGSGSARPGPSFTFGTRVSSDPREKASALVPGPGSYQAARSLEHTSGEVRAPAFTMGERLRDPASEELSSVGPAGFSERPGPGEYHDDGGYVIGDLGESGPGFTMYERLGDGAVPRKGRDGPGPAHYVGPFDPASAGEATRASPGARAPSFAPNVMSGRDAPGGPRDQVANAVGIPGPGYYAPEVFQFPRRDPGGDEAEFGGGGGGNSGGEFLWAPKGYTFGWKGAFGDHLPRETDPTPGPGEYQSGGPLTRSLGDSSEWRPRGITIGARLGREAERARRSAEARPGPGSYRTAKPFENAGPAGARGPKRGAIIRSRSAWERQKARERRGAGPGPGAYDAANPRARRHAEKRAPKYTIATRLDAPSAADARRRAAEPAPGEYEPAPSFADRRLSAGPTIVGERRPSPGAESGRLVPAPGEYEPDAATAEARRRRDARSAVAIGRAPTRDAPGGAFDAAVRGAAEPTPGPGAFESSGRSGGGVGSDGRTPVRIGKGATRARGGAFDERRAAETPGPGEFEPDEADLTRKQKRLPGFTIPSATRDRGVSASDATPGPGAHWPDDAPGGDSYSSGNASSGNNNSASKKGFTIPRTGHASVGGALSEAVRRGAATPGPGETHGELEYSRASADPRRAPGVTIPRAGRDAGRSRSAAARDSAPGPGEYHDGGAGGSTLVRRGAVPFGNPPPRESAAGDNTATAVAAEYPTPGPGAYFYDASGPPLDRPRGGSVPRAARRSSLAARDAADRPGPGDHEPDPRAGGGERPHPMTVAGLIQERIRAGKGPRIGGPEGPTSAPAGSRLGKKKGVTWGASVVDPRPGPGAYEPSADPRMGRPGRGASLRTREAFEKANRAEVAAGSGLGPDRYDPNPDAASRGTRVARREPRGNDFADSKASAKTITKRGASRARSYR